jgi:quinoprotein dehydrogenase-associated probable ABC transporter substrate-binding protein
MAVVALVGAATFATNKARATDGADAAGTSSVARTDEHRLRVCADPNNLPFSNKAGEGFENKLAELVASKLNEKVVYTWWAARRGFIRNTLKAGNCDAVMSAPAGYNLVEATQPYYRSTYVFVSRADRHLDLSSVKDQRLRKLRIGVHLIGDDGANTPPAHALGDEGIIENVAGYPIYGDYRQANPPLLLLDALAKGDLDVAAVWGPLAGYYARSSAVPLTIAAIEPDADLAPLSFQFSITMGVRKGDHALKARLDDIITHNKPEIRALLESYGVPVVKEPARNTGAAVAR